LSMAQRRARADYRVRDDHPFFARFYEHVGPLMDRGGLAAHRADLLAGLSGSVIEVGAGSGLSFCHYPAAVTAVLAVEPDRRLRLAASRAAERAPVPVRVVGGIAERLPAPAESFDAAVVCLVLCTVADGRAAIGELARVLRPGGQLRFFEHVAASGAVAHRMQRLLDASLWPLMFGGCHLSRDTVTAVGVAGFTVSRLDQIRFPDARLAPSFVPHVRGVGHRSARRSGEVTDDGAADRG
jgi:ubiquinone/menaquinone biosynthesis C-methylase UbiE